MTPRPPYALAALAALLVLAGYVVTLAPTVTFWDAGEFITAAKTLGIPHPPGTPLFVMIGHVWGALVPLAEYAQRTNLLSATLSAAGAGFWYLVAHDTLARATKGMEEPAARVIARGGALAGTLVAGFTFTMWQNSNETEVYATATFTIALITWLCLVWREVRGTQRAAHILLLILYLAGLSIGNHLLALLVGPAVVAFIVATLRDRPSESEANRTVEWAQVAVVAGAWALLIGGGLGSTTLTILGGAAFLVAALVAYRARSASFALVALVVAAIGVTSYLFLFIRAGQHPPINEAQPDNWDALLAVIRREQYPVRTPLDDPTVAHGPGNPGRSVTVIGLQLLNYIQYFDWQWMNGLRKTVLVAGLEVPLRLAITLLFGGLGLRGLFLQRRTDRAAWWLLFTLWLATGLGLVAYMNFKPGFSLGYNIFPDSNDHEVRDRDYFFIVSFVVWGLWAGMGIASAARGLTARWRLSPAIAAIPLGLLAMVPFVGNFSTASRRHGPDARLAADFAYDLLNSLPPYGILFTYGDNDTFPLWWAQEVAGIRQDVLVVCLALAETDWYKRQLRDNPVRPFDGAAAPALWQGANPQMPGWKPHGLTDTQIGQSEGRLLPNDITLRIGPITHVLRRGTPLYSRDFVVLRLLQDNLGRRPIGWSLTTGSEYYGLDQYLLQQGLVMRLDTATVDATRADIDNHRILGVALDVPTTEKLIWETYRYAGLATSNRKHLEPTAAGVAGNLSLPFAQLAYAHAARGRRDAALKNVEQASLLSTNPALKQALSSLLDRPVRDSGP